MKLIVNKKKETDHEISGIGKKTFKTTAVLRNVFRIPQKLFVFTADDFVRNIAYSSSRNR
jgi:hypothetical protein